MRMTNSPSQQKTWIVFSGETDLPWLKVLKKNYRHCFVLINDGINWITLDPLASYIDVQIHRHLAESFDLPTWLESRGAKVIAAKVNRVHKKPAPIMFFSCVEFIKRSLGIHSRFIITPWQLYRYLEQQQSHKEVTPYKGELSWVV